MAFHKGEILRAKEVLYCQKPNFPRHGIGRPPGVTGTPVTLVYKLGHQEETKS